MRVNLSLVAALAFPLCLAACGDPPTYLDGKDFSTLQLHVYSDTMGIFPDRSILLDSNNPFAHDLPSDMVKWDLQASAGPIVAFYSWASLLANAPNGDGEEQYYVGINLQQMLEIGKVDEATKPKATKLAVGAYLSVLYNFPTSVTYDPTGTIAYDLATPSYKAVVALAGMSPPGWALVKDSQGNDRAVRP
jgi:hypothetical protein